MLFIVVGSTFKMMTHEQLFEIFRKNSLSIEANANMKVINFLDFTFDLNRGSFSPYKKPNNVINFVQKKQPPTNYLKKYSS